MAPLTQRDKKLLGFLAIVIVLFVFIRLLIMPQMEQYFDLDTEIELAELEKHEMNLKIVSVEGTKKRNEELKEELLDASEAYYPMLSSQEIDREITGIFLKFGGNIENLSITMPSGPSDLKMYVGWQGISGETPVQDGTGVAEKIAQEQIDSGNARVQDKTRCGENDAESDEFAQGCRTGSGVCSGCGCKVYRNESADDRDD